MSTTIGMPVHTTLTFDAALVRVPEALKAEGLSLIHISEPTRPY